jgi:hypothetical protein
MQRLGSVVVLLLLHTVVFASVVEYRTADGVIRGIDPTDTMLEDHARVEIDPIVFPAPSGCSVGRMEWTRVVADTLVLDSRIGSTHEVFECKYLVGSKADVYLDMFEEIQVLTQSYKSNYDHIERIVNQLSAQCTVADGTTHLISRRTTTPCTNAWALVDALIATIDDTALEPVLTAIGNLLTRAATLIATKGW